jgi:hypothetical protein
MVRSKGAAMSERDRRSSATPLDRAQPPSAVRVISAKAPAAAPPPALGGEVAGDSAVLRPVQFDQLTEVVDLLRAGRAVRLTMDGLPDRAEQRRAWAFVQGASCALGISPAPAGTLDDTVFLDPCDSEGRAGHADADARGAKPAARERSPRDDVARDATCVLCDLRTADREFEPRLEMVIKRDGSRIWSPPAMVCSHCRTTIRHWQFALAWCSECERWGRRNVVSPCGQLYG